MTFHLLLAFQLLGVVVWMSVGALPLARRPTPSPTLWAFVLFAFAMAAYGLLGAVNVPALEPEVASTLLRGQVTAAALLPLLFMYFAKWLVSTRRRTDLLLILPPVALLPVGWSLLIENIVATPWGYTPVWSPAIYLLWALVVLGYAFGGFLYMGRGIGKFREGLLVQRWSYVFILVAGVTLVVYSVVRDVAFVDGVARLPPPSTLFFLPGVGFLAVVAPVTRETLSAFVRRVVGAGQEILHAFLIYHGGSLIAHRSLEGEAVPDEDIFSAVMEALQQALKASVPRLGRAWLDAIHQGGLKILMERGAYCFIVLVTTGREDDLLRGEMHDLLDRFERRNATALQDWKGDPDGLAGRQETVDFFFELNRVF